MEFSGRALRGGSAVSGHVLGAGRSATRKEDSAEASRRTRRDADLDRRAVRRHRPGDRARQPARPAQVHRGRSPAPHSGRPPLDGFGSVVGGACRDRPLVERYGVDPRLVRAIAWWESGFNNSLVSAAGARGVMQVTPATWSYVELVLVGHHIPSTVSGNVQVGVAFLDQLLHEFRGNVRLALAAYAQGPQSVRRHGLFRETRQYVAGVLSLSGRV